MAAHPKVAGGQALELVLQEKRVTLYVEVLTQKERKGD